MNLVAKLCSVSRRIFHTSMYVFLFSFTNPLIAERQSRHDYRLLDDTLYATTDDVVMTSLQNVKIEILLFRSSSTKMLCYWSKAYMY
jgi:hypothetical protein